MARRGRNTRKVKKTKKSGSRSSAGSRDKRYTRGNASTRGITTYIGIGFIVIIAAVIAVGILNWGSVLRMSANIVDDMDGGPTPMPSIGPTAEATATPKPTEVVLVENTPEPTATVEPTATPRPDEQIIKISAVGDIMVHQSQLDDAYNANLDTYDFSGHFDEIAPIIQSADLAIGNLETTIAGEDQQYSGNPPTFNTPAELLTALKDTGFDLLTLANEHVFDRKWYGLQQTIANIEEAGMESTGAYLSLNDYYAPLILDVEGLKVAVIAYTYGTEGNEASISSEQLNYGIKYIREESIKRDIAQCEADGAEIIIISMHWGEEYETAPDNDMKSMAQSAIMAGADIIIGSHPHIVQKVTYKSFTRDDDVTSMGAVVYSMGNFISSQTGENQDNGIIANINIYKNNLTGEVRLDGVEYVPVYVSKDKTGSSLTDFELIPLYDYLNDEALFDTLSSTEQNNMQDAWDYIVKTIGRTVATPVEKFVADQE